MTAELQKKAQKFLERYEHLMMEVSEMMGFALDEVRNSTESLSSEDEKEWQDRLQKTVPFSEFLSKKVDQETIDEWDRQVDSLWCFLTVLRRDGAIPTELYTEAGDKYNAVPQFIFDEGIHALNRFLIIQQQNSAWIRKMTIHDKNDSATLGDLIMDLRDFSTCFGVSLLPSKMDSKRTDKEI